MSLVWMLMLSGCAATAVSPSGGPAPTATSGALRITTDHASYASATPIGVAVSNAGDADLYALDGRSACAIIQLQRYDATAHKWISVVGCSQASGQRVNRIAAGVTIPFTLAPTSSGDPNKWDGGMYRVAAAYSANADGTTDGQIAFSTGFTIG